MTVENTQSQMRKGILEFCILSIIRREAAYPGDIINELRSAGISVLEGTLYPLLTRLKNSGLLSYEWKESVSGPPRKYFSLTNIGLTTLIELEKTWKELADSVNNITHPSKS